MFFKDEYFFLSNFYPASFTFHDICFKSSEHFYMASKTFNKIEQNAIINAPNPGKAKLIGRNCTLRSDWEEVKFNIMYQAIYHKFTQNRDILKKLLDTGDMYLEEGNTWHDNIYGNCVCEKCIKIEGKNALGKLLMILRYNLRNN